MLTYCLKCKKHIQNVDSKMLKTKSDRQMLSLKCAVCGSQKIKIYERTRSKRIIE